VQETASAAEKRKVDRRLHLTPDEANRLIAAAGKRGRYPDRDRVLVRLIYRHGLRASEACELRWDHLDLDEGSITVRRRKMGKDSTHTMDRDELRDLRKLRRETNSPFVFSTERGGPFSVRALQYIVGEAGKQAGLPEELCHPHALRHAAGYSLINNDVDVRLVQEFLGHKTPAMTMHYTAISPKRLSALRVR
jgi:type 1 fimbriae regulatory protein FimB/type 1 fimbriae regulatory protein FimE